MVAIEPGHKRLGSYMHGRWFPGAGWNAYATEPASEKTLAHMASWPNAGIGIVLGFRVGDYIVGGLDFDTTDPAELAALQEPVPASPMTKIGAKGETRFYRFGPNIVSKSYKIGGRGVLDLLAKGRQSVMPPTVHPQGTEYAWKDGCGLTDAAQLPVFTAAHLAALEARLESAITTAAVALAFSRTGDPATSEFENAVAHKDLAVSPRRWRASWGRTASASIA